MGICKFCFNSDDKYINPPKKVYEIEENIKENSKVQIDKLNLFLQIIEGNLKFFEEKYDYYTEEIKKFIQYDKKQNAKQDIVVKRMIEKCKIKYERKGIFIQNQISELIKMTNEL